MKHCLLSIVFTLLALSTSFSNAFAQHTSQLYPTKYDWSAVAAQITTGCTTKYEQAEAIYRWLCQNIAYDTTYSIHDADTCWDNKRGVCQAYSELFYRLGEPLGLEVIIVTGDTKEDSGKLADDGHAWVIVGTDKYHILIDPTWGAGSVKDGVFTRSKNDMSWFDVNPYWMIFTHFPDNPDFQMLPQPIDMASFLRLPQINPHYGDFGWNAKECFEKGLAGNLALPKVFKNRSEDVKCLLLPKEKYLRVGQEYDFVVEKMSKHEVAIKNNEFFMEDKWGSDGNRRGIRFMPVSDADKVILMIKRQDGKYDHIAEYEVLKATESDWANVAEKDPFALPEIQKIKGFNRHNMELLHLDGKQFMRLYNSGKVGSELPKIYTTVEELQAVDLPLMNTLSLGSCQTFTFRPLKSIDWVIIYNDEWLREWTPDVANGTLSMNVNLSKPGSLKISVLNPSDGKYYTALEYTVR